MYQYQVSFSQAVRMAFDSYCRFQGRSSRSEYWWWVLFVAILSFCIGIIEGILGFSMTAVQATFGILSLVLLLPGLGLSVRRLHDINKSGWWILLGLIPVVGGIVLIIWFARDSEMTENAMAPCPIWRDDSHVSGHAQRQ